MIKSVSDRNRFPLHSQEAEDAGFDEHYFRRRPKSFCLQPNSASVSMLPPGVAGLQQQQQQQMAPRNIYATLGGPGAHPMQQHPLPPLPPAQANLYSTVGGGGYGFVGGSQAEQASLHLSMGSLLEEQMMHRAGTPGAMVREPFYTCEMDIGRDLFFLWNFFVFYSSAHFSSYSAVVCEFDME